METIAELILQMLGGFFEIFGELFLQLIAEVIAEILGHRVKRPSTGSEPVRPWLAILGYSLFGIMLGAVSLWLQPELLIKPGRLRNANLILTPIIAGLLMAWVGTWRRNHQRQVIRLETFACGFCFALAMALVRYVFGK